jgi:hypothetical protein
MRHAALFLAVCLSFALFAVGCSSIASPQPVEEPTAGYAERSPSTHATSAPVVSSSGGYGYRAHRAASPPAPPASAPQVSSREPRPAPEERPGLGTMWGETRSSPVRDVPFERASEQPPSVIALYYNDRAGVDAMTTYDLRRAAHLDAPVAVRGGLTVSVIDESGAPLEATSVGGRIYVIGEAGRRYSLVIHNQSARRYEAVASVDGLDVVDGQPASVEKRGYLINPWGTITIDGFRRSREVVAAFRFGSVASSYAARTAGDRHVGVIGVAFFSEEGTLPLDGGEGSPPWDDGEIERRRSAEPFADARFAEPPR